jgi:hypothetical protein
MIYKFRSKAAGDVIMLGPNGDQFLRLIGREPAPKGILEVADMAAAVQALESAVAADEAARAEARRDAEARGDEPPRGGEGVTLRQRVWPMVEMIRRAASARHPIVWGV